MLVNNCFLVLLRHKDLRFLKLWDSSKFHSIIIIIIIFRRINQISYLILRLVIKRFIKLELSEDNEYNLSVMV